MISITIAKKVVAARGKVQIAYVLVGNKCDLSSDRQVSTEEGANRAKSFGCPLFETSAKTPTNVEEAFMCLFQMCSCINENSEEQEGGNKGRRKCIIC